MMKVLGIEYLATTVHSKCDTVKVYDSSFYYLDKDSLQIVEYRLRCEIKYH